MLWFNNKVNKLIFNINSKDIAFLLTSSLEVNKQKRSKLKVQTALGCLNSHASFHDYIFEFFLKEKMGKLRCAAISGVTKDLMGMYYGRRAMPGSLVSEVFNSRKTRFVVTTNNEPGRRGEFLRRTNTRASLLVPIEDFGVLVVNRFDTDKFSDYELTLLKYFVDEIVKSSLELALDNEKNFNAAIRDSMTDLYNHGYFLFQLEREIENAKRDNYPISLIMIDLDYFKHYNDLHGHPRGDKVLIDIAKILKYNTRWGDVVARYGGEEFVVVLHNAKLKFAVAKAERLRTAVSNFRFYKEEMQPNRDLTISLGVASFPETVSNSSELIEKADKALYFSKNNGKNRVSVYGREIR